jgi:CheY-like chemotaxis protein
VLCDIGLPQMDGYSVARKLRQDARLQDSLLVAVSGYAQSEDARRAREAGFDEHLAKPLRLNRLETLLGRAKSNH